MSILIIVKLTLTHTKTEMFNVNKLAKHIPFQNKIKVLRISTNLKMLQKHDVYSDTDTHTRTLQFFLFSGTGNCDVMTTVILDRS